MQYRKSSVSISCLRMRYYGIVLHFQRASTLVEVFNSLSTASDREVDVNLQQHSKTLSNAKFKPIWQTRTRPSSSSSSGQMDVRSFNTLQIEVVVLGFLSNSFSLTRSLSPPLSQTHTYTHTHNIYVSPSLFISLSSYLYFVFTLPLNSLSL